MRPAAYSIVNPLCDWNLPFSEMYDFLVKVFRNDDFSGEIRELEGPRRQDFETDDVAVFAN
jgi:hypothetical protein